ncbi:hypothetical protein GQ54DRAFT_95989 [Martensiomyces pterosporus]|nr:hypothetical protein GQ54DRAFT_95989 [Martensiomyces pterosporus]
MVLTNQTLSAVRFWLLVAAIVLTFIEFIVDAVALASLKTTYVLFFKVTYGDEKGAAGWTMFLVIVSLFLIPAVTFGRALVNKGLGFADHLNRTLTELIIVTVLTGLWFISGIVLAVYAGNGSCHGSSTCSKYKAATAFAWLLFFDLLVVNIIVGIIFNKQKTNGLDVKTAYTVDLDAQGTGSLPAPATAGQTSYYQSSQPNISMPQPMTDK